MKRPVGTLGRGLASLMGEINPGEAPAIAELKPTAISPNPFQPRAPIQAAELAELVLSIQSSGLLQPILVRPDPIRPGHYQIVAGERRWRAAQLANLPVIPCLVRAMSDTEAATAALVENLQRRDLNAMEEAEGFKRLIDEFDLTHDELAISVSKSRSHVANTIRLLALPEIVAEHIRMGRLTAGHARAALGCEDPVKAAEQMIERQLNVRQAETLRLQRPTTPDGPNQISGRDAGPDRLAAEAELAELLGLKVAITFDGRGGTLKLRYQTLDQLDHLVILLSRG